MLADLGKLFDELEARRQLLVNAIGELSTEQLTWTPGPDRWSILQTVQHIVLGEQGLRQSEAELRDNLARPHLKPGKLVAVVKDILDRDVPVNVPDPSLEPHGRSGLSEILATWEQERRALKALLDSISAAELETVMFSHPAAGPLTPALALQLALSHFDTHRRQIDRLGRTIANTFAS